MKNSKKLFGILILCALTLFSCRKEDTEIIQPTPEEAFDANSDVANLLRRTATNDGSYDNILDRASCFDILLPVTVIANGIEVVVENEDDLDTVEDIFDEFPDDEDSLVIQFPITIVLDDYSQVIINNQSELDLAALQCPGNGSEDDDIECIDIQYPITAQVFNQNNELIDTIVINNDEALFNFINNLDPSEIVTFDFPFSVILWDGTVVEIDNFAELVSVILSVINACDEDDDNDPNDDDCNNCTDQQVIDLLTGCDDWMVDKLERNDTDLEDLYVGYLFNFEGSGALTVDFNGNTENGTWSASGTGNAITVVINIPTLPDFNDSWIVHEIEQQAGEQKLDLRLGEDRLRFESDCASGGGGGIDDTALVNALTNGDWYVNYFFDDTDQTAVFSDFLFNFATDNTATATDAGGTTNGVWSTSAGDETELELNLNFGSSIPLDELADDWDVLEVTNDIIRLKDISGGDGSVDFLTFGRNPFSGGGGGGGNDLSDFLDDGTWFVFSYDEDGDDQTANYAGYSLDFNAMNSTVVASNGSNTNNGTWQVLNAGNTLQLDFGVQLPFEEFNDDWDVLDATNTQITLQDVSGGGGGTDTLVLRKQ